MSETKKTPTPVAPELVEKAWSARESWRVFGIMAEFVESTERLAHIRPAVSVFGSARIEEGHQYYELARQIARSLSDAGFADVTTEILEAPVFYFAEDYHQQYLAKNPGGYCGIGGTGVTCPIGTGVSA